MIFMNVSNIETFGYIHELRKSYHISIIIDPPGHFKRVIFAWLQLVVSINQEPLFAKKKPYRVLH